MNVHFERWAYSVGQRMVLQIVTSNPRALVLSNRRRILIQQRQTSPLPNRRAGKITSPWMQKHWVRSAYKWNEMWKLRL